MVGISGVDKKVIVKTLDNYTEQKNRELVRIQREDDDNKRIDDMNAAFEARHETHSEAHAKERAEAQERVRKMDEDDPGT